MSKLILVQWTAVSLDQAREISQGLVCRRLVACASIFPHVESWYIWEEKLEQSQEVKVLLKTLEKNYPAIEAYITEHHTHVVPEILILPITGGFAPYLDWVGSLDS